MMKKGWTILLVAALLLALCFTSAFAGHFGACRTGDCRQSCPLSCDGSACRFSDEDGDGLCDLCGRAAGDACRFSDEDGDGLCDNRAGVRPQDGTGYRQGGRGHCGR